MGHTKKKLEKKSICLFALTFLFVVDVDRGVGGAGADAFDMYQMNDSSESEPVLALLHDDLDLDAISNQTFSPYVIDGYNETGNWTGWVSNDANQTQNSQSILDRKLWDWLCLKIEIVCFNSRWGQLLGPSFGCLPLSYAFR